MKSNIVAALICALAIPAAAFAAGTVERPAGKKHVVVAQNSHAKKARAKSTKTRSMGKSAPKAGPSTKLDSSAK